MIHGKITSLKTSSKKPRVNFCWGCGNKLRGKYYAEKVIMGQTKIMHKSCAEKIEDRSNHYDQEYYDYVDQTGDDYREFIDPLND